MRIIIILLIILTTGVSYGKDIFTIQIDGVITGYTEKYIRKSLDKATEAKGALLIKLDTPGGILESTRGIVQTILESDVPVITFVAPQGSRAGSAGTFIVLASHYAVMAEGTNIGAAHPVNITGKDIEGHMAQKVENDTVAFIKSIAEKRGRNIKAAEETVTLSKSYTATEALDLMIIDSIANTDEQVVKLATGKLGFTAGEIIYLKATPMQKVAFFLSDPNVLVMLLFIGMLAIVLEFKMPGTFVFATIGISAILMFLMGINIIPVNSLALLLVIAGVGLLGAEIFVPSFGLLTVASMASLGAGLYLLFSTDGNLGIGVSVWLISILIGSILSVTILIGRLIFKDFKSKPKTGIDTLKDEIGTVVNWNDNNGQVFVHGELWSAKSEEVLEKDDKVAIVDVDGMMIKVEKASV